MDQLGLYLENLGHIFYDECESHLTIELAEGRSVQKIAWNLKSVIYYILNIFRACPEISESRNEVQILNLFIFT